MTKAWTDSPATRRTRWGFSWSHVMRRSLLAILLVVLVVPAVSGPASARHAQSFHHRYRFARQHMEPMRAENFAPGLYAYAPDAYAPAFETRETNMRRNSGRQSEWGQNNWSQSNWSQNSFNQS